MFCFVFFNGSIIPLRLCSHVLYPCLNGLLPFSALRHGAGLSDGLTSFPVDMYPGVELPDHTVGLVAVF